MNSIWFTKQPNLKLPKQKAMSTALWTRPEHPQADIVQIGGHSVETVHNITHGVFLQYEVRAHSFERVNFLTFKDQYHLKERPEETTDRYHAALKGNIHPMYMMQTLVRLKYLKPLMGME